VHGPVRLGKQLGQAVRDTANALHALNGLAGSIPAHLPDVLRAVLLASRAHDVQAVARLVVVLVGVRVRNRSGTARPTESTMSSTLQQTSVLPAAVTAIDRDGVSSSWAGHWADHQVSCCLTPSKTAMTYATRTRHF
jgi:hypothetical protein